jgi:hypothetical protein
MATLGLEPEIGSTGELSLKDLTEQLRRSAPAWSKLMGKPVAEQQVTPTAQPVAEQPTTPSVVAATQISRW